jgi:hypothetical protein
MDAASRRGTLTSSAQDRRVGAYNMSTRALEVLSDGVSAEPAGIPPRSMAFMATSHPQSPDPAHRPLPYLVHADEDGNLALSGALRCAPRSELMEAPCAQMFLRPGTPRQSSRTA